MKKLLLGFLLALGLGAATAAVVVMTGVIDVGADTPHSSVTHQVLTLAREQSIARRAGNIQVPADFADPERVRRGAGNYAAMCVDCHLSPQAPDSEIRQGLNPQPPSLTEQPAAAARDAARDFWIVKHGIKATGMPAWAQGGMDDQAIWDLAAFVQQLPALSAAAYQQLVAASDDHAHGGLDGQDHGHADHAATAAATPPEKPVAKTTEAPSHDHGSHDHGTHKH
jgi:cytochrome c553